MALPKFEGLITVPTGGWAFNLEEVTPNGGPTAVTIPAGGYYLTTGYGAGTSLLATIKAQMEAAIAGAVTYTVTLDDDNDTSTGKVTIAGSGVTTFNITWTSLTLRNLLGFTGNLSGAATYTGTEHAEFLWLPNVGRRSPLRAPDGSAGAYMTDGTVTVSPSGKSKRLAYATRRVDRYDFENLRGYKTWITHEQVANESLEKFWSDVIYPGIAVRYVKSRAVDATHTDVVFLANDGFAPEHLVPFDNARALWSWGSDAIQSV